MPIELPSPGILPPTAPPPAAPEPAETYASRLEALSAPVVERPAAVVARSATAEQQEVLFVPLAVSVGDGFKFGCGFFLALVVAMLIGFVLFAAMFVLTTLFGLNLPLTH